MGPGDGRAGAWAVAGEGLRLGGAEGERFWLSECRSLERRG